MKSFLYLTTCILTLTASPIIAAEDGMSEDGSSSSSSYTRERLQVGEKRGRYPATSAEASTLRRAKEVSIDAAESQPRQFAIPTTIRYLKQ